MFPIRDENPHFLTPWATYALIAANLAAWFGVQGMGTSLQFPASLCDLGLIPASLLGHVQPGFKLEMGPGVVCVFENPSWRTMVTSMFLHGGWFHIIGNLWFLWVFGNNVEDSMGHLRFIIFYLLCGLAAAGLQIYSAPESTVPMVGASGAIGGVMGAYVMLYPRVRVHMLVILGFYVTTIGVPAFAMLAYWFLIQLLGGMAALSQAAKGGIAFWAHIGGFGAGAFLILFFKNHALVNRHPFHGWNPRRR